MGLFYIGFVLGGMKKLVSEAERKRRILSGKEFQDDISSTRKLFDGVPQRDLVFVGMK